MRLVLALLISASPLAAQESRPVFGLPAGCTAYVTVQSTSCEVSHYFTCQGDPEGHQRRVSLDEQGVVYAGEIDFETQWIASFHALTGHSETLVPNPTEPASLSDLIAHGVDDYDFSTMSDQFGETRFSGQDTLTGREVTIDGVTLLETTYDITASTPDGTVIWSAKGNEFINPDWRVFLAGTGVVTSSEGQESRDDRPVEFIFPGEPGFLSAQPKHGCGLAISSAPLSEENTYDQI
ncbi:hypothetical protein [Loktanella sp. S4079]|uniref:hypothetical protein n=1 Tax=Loktanella sp. S4079 TaxID=579483 RepID=UPI0006975C9D|nr:hypothetical protein [Loktanella sp. S4079]